MDLTNVQFELSWARYEISTYSGHFNQKLLDSGFRDVDADDIDDFIMIVTEICEKFWSNIEKEIRRILGIVYRDVMNGSEKTC